MDNNAKLKHDSSRVSAKRSGWPMRGFLCLGAVCAAFMFLPTHLHGQESDSDRPQIALKQLESNHVDAKGAASKHRIEDERIEFAIEKELSGAKAIAENQIRSEVVDGIATLSGTVSHIYAKESAIQIAKITRGVRAVVDEIRVDPEDRTDTAIRTDVLNTLARDPATDTWEITTYVTDGVATLRGTVDSYAEKELAGKIAKAVRGVVDLKNELEWVYRTDRSDYEITQDIAERLAWDLRLDDELITVTVDQGQVTLAGSVGSAYEKTLAYGNAWVAGVTSVDDDSLVVVWWSRDTMQRNDSVQDFSDAKIRAAVKTALRFDPRVDSFNPDVTIDDATVVLSGVVDNLKAKRAASQDARNTVGVQDVRNELRVRPPSQRSDKKLQRDIEEAFARDPLLSPLDIAVEVVDGKAFLRGQVEAKYQKWQAEDLASRVSGVTGVHDLTSIGP